MNQIKCAQWALFILENRLLFERTIIKINSKGAKKDIPTYSSYFNKIKPLLHVKINLMTLQ